MYFRQYANLGSAYENLIGCDLACDLRNWINKINLLSHADWLSLSFLLNAMKIADELNPELR